VGDIALFENCGVIVAEIKKINSESKQIQVNQGK